MIEPLPVGNVRFSTALGQDNEDGLCLVLPLFRDAGSVASQDNKSGSLAWPNSWKETICKRFMKTNTTLEDVVFLNSYT